MNSTDQNKFTIQQPFAISAGAGSGKTYTLSRRFINILVGFDFFIESPEQEQYAQTRRENRADIEQIVTLTYTEAAALEMKERIFALMLKIIDFKTLDPQDGDYASIKMGYAKLDDDAQRHVVLLLMKAESEIIKANITTIHGFCLEMLQRHSDVAKIDGALEVLDDEEKDAIFESIFLEVLNHADFQDEILFITRHVSLFKSKALIRRYVFNHKFRTAFDQYESNRETIKTLLVTTFLVPLESAIEGARKELQGNERSEAFDAFINSFYEFEAKEYPYFAKQYGVSKSLGVKKFPCADPIKNELKNLVSTFSVIDDELEKRFDEVIERFRKLLKAIKSSYDAQLHRAGKIDFDTIIQKVAQIIPRIDHDIRYIMVDEFQDTNAVQWEIVQSIAARGADLFVVGDEKQSIYAFQGGEIEVFHRAIRDRFAGQTVQMGENFRSDRAIIAFVNELFSSLLALTEPIDTENVQIRHDYEARYEPLISMSKNEGSVTFLVSKGAEEESEADNIAQFIKSIVEQERYPDIGKKIALKEPAIAVLYDAKGKMLELRDALQALGVSCKVSASEDFYQAVEITDIFYVLKALHILSYVPSLDKLGNKQRFFVVGAMRSSIMHFSDRQIYESLRSEALPEWFEHWKNRAAVSSIHRLISEMLTENAAYSAYALQGRYEQCLANVNKLLLEVMAFEHNHGYDLGEFTKRMEESIFHSNADHDEAFYLSESGGSIELRTIHSSKGLAFPMVIIPNSAKNLSSQPAKESVKYNRFNDTNDETHNLIGFDINAYKPLSQRLLKTIDVRKHIAEKKRLFYVALTRPRNHLVISADFKQTQKGIGSIDNSYLQMTLDSLGITKEALFHHEDLPEGHDYIHKEDLTQYPAQSHAKSFEPVDGLEPMTFTQHASKSATEKKEMLMADNEALERSALRGTMVHKALELFWGRLDDDAVFDQMFHKEGILDTALQTEIKSIARNFLRTDTYRHLQEGARHHFEFTFDEVIDGDEQRGSIDLLLEVSDDAWMIVDFKSGQERDDPAYEAQLAFYKEVMQNRGFNIVRTEICWLG